MLKSSTWFQRTILEEDEAGQTTLTKLLERRKALLKIWAVGWFCFLFMVFSLIVIVRFAASIPF